MEAHHRSSDCLEGPITVESAVSFRFASGPTDLTALAACLHGSVVRPGDDAYDEDRLVWNMAHQGSPVAIVRAADAGDVATAVEFARSNGLEIAVRSGGHSVAGHSSGDGVLVIDMRDLRGLHIDPSRRLAWAGAGLTAGEYTAAAAAHGLATPFGDTGTVGIAGLTLGGGIGWLARKHGLAIDALVEAEVVTADGEVLTASDTEHPDLFWAIRGGGGNFGIVTRFTYRLYPVDQVLGGAIFLQPTREVLRDLVPMAEAAPDELTTIGFVMPLPPVPFVPQEHHGKPSLVLMFVYAGDPEAGQAAIAPFAALGEPFGVGAMPMPYPAIYEHTAAGGERHPSTIRSLFMDDLDAASIEVIVDALATAPAGSMLQLRVFGGEMSRVPADATAFAHRGAKVMLAVMNAFEDPTAVEAATAWNRSLFAALEPKAVGAYANFLEDEGDARIRIAYPGPTYDRLAQVKRRYDPANVFHRNQNIRPG
jgi:FAD/FMN-containing dehydrogenase